MKQKLSNSDKKFVGFWSPRKLVEVFDEAIKGMYGHRTDALQDAMRDLIRKLEEEKRQKEVGSLGP